MTHKFRKLQSLHRALSRGTVATAAVLVLSVTSAPALATAQGLLSVGAGVGGGVGDRKSDASGSGTHGAVYLQFHPPVIPFALRADALFTRTTANTTGLALLGDAIVIAPIPVVQPYVLLGYGRYGIGKDSSSSGWNAGVGARFRTPWVAIYAEARRHKQVSRDLLTIGVSR